MKLVCTAGCSEARPSIASTCNPNLCAHICCVENLVHFTAVSSKSLQMLGYFCQTVSCLLSSENFWQSRQVHI